MIHKILLFATGILLATNLGAQPVLKDVFKTDFLIGAALNPSQFTESNPVEAALVKKQFNSITPENVLKWAEVHPSLMFYDFTLADRYVEFGEKNKMAIIGHTLIWHNQTLPRVFEVPAGKLLGRDELLKRMRDHIHTVVGRYKGRIKGWDVVNEALAEDGTLRQSPWLKIIGEDYIAKAFEFAHEADPGAELYYNDYSLENPPKRAGAIALITKLKSQGLSVSAIGLQGHYSLDWPKLGQIDATIEAFSKLGVKVMITELDVDVLPAAWDQGSADVTRDFQLQKKLNPYVDGLPEEIQKKLAKRYADLFQLFAKHHPAITRITFWGVTDASSWLNYWPVKGRTNYPLLFDRNANPKPAFDAILRTKSVKN